MSKLLKRTLALALIFCLVLSVIPAVSAEQPTETVTYTFTNSSKVNLKTITKDSGKNWYYLKAPGTPTIDSSAISMNTAYTNYWYAVVINVPAAGYYDVSTSFNTQAGRPPVVQMCLLDPNNMKDSTTTYRAYLEGAARADVFTSLEWEAGGVVNHSLNHLGNSNVTPGYAFLGNCYLNEGEYIFGVNVRAVGSTGNSSVKSLTLKPSTEAGSTFIATVNAAGKKDGAQNWSQIKEVYQLAANVEAPNSDLKLSGVNLETNGFNLNVKSLWVTETNSGVVSGVTDTKGTTEIVTQSAPLYANATDSFTMFDAAANEGNGAYKLVKPTTTVTPGAGATVTNPYVVEDGVVRFGFDVALPETAYAYAAAEQAPVKFWFSFKVGDNEAKTVEFANDVFDIQEWITSKSADKAFFVDLQGIDELEADTEITFTPYVQVLNVSIPCGTVTYTVPAA